jgi:hypothetical protein
VSEPLPLGQSLEALHLAPPVRDAVARWLTEPRCADDRDVLAGWIERAAAGDDDARNEIVDAFSGELPIGTAGRRGAVGPGPNRMNLAVLRDTAQGLVNAMRDEALPSSVAIVFDTRRDSQRFAHAVAAQLAANGVDVTVVDAPRPTPLLSHMVRARGCGAGIVISASHNPPTDNGIKVFGPDGAQVLGARSDALMRAISIAGKSALPVADPESPRIVLLGSEEAVASVEEPYLAFVRRQGVGPDPLPDSGLRVVFTPLHGVGPTLIRYSTRNFAKTLCGRGSNRQNGFGLTLGLVDLLRLDGFRFLDDALLLTLCLVDIGIAYTFRCQNHGAFLSLCTHLFFHGTEHILRRINILDLVA